MGFFKNILRMGKDEDYEEGMRLYNRHQYREALEKFEAVIRKKSSGASLHRNLAEFYAGYAQRNLGITHFAVCNYAAALQEFEKALQHCKNPEEINLFIGICQNNLGDFEAAVRTFTAMLESDPTSLPTRLKLGMALHNMRMWGKAVEVYSAILEQKPGYADVHYRLGMALLGKGEPGNAALSFEKALDINPGYAHARIKLGLSYAHMGQFDQALAQFNEILAQSPGFADVHYFAGIVHSSSGRIDAAVSCLNQALQINPSFKEARIKLATLECHRGDSHAAISELRKAARLDPSDRELALALETLMETTSGLEPGRSVAEELQRLFGGDEPLADVIQKFNRNLKINPDLSSVLTIIKDFSKENTALCDMLIPVILDYIHEHPNYPDLHNTLGDLYQKLGSHKLAEKSFREAVRLNPAYLNARINLFKSLLGQARYEDALEHGRWILGTEVEYPDIFMSMGRTLMALGRDDEAMPYLEKALTMRPRYATAHYLKGQLLARRSSAVEALASFEACLQSSPSPDLAEDARTAISELKQAP